MKKTKQVLLALAMSAVMASAVVPTSMPVWADDVQTIYYDGEKREVKTSGDYSYIVMNNEAYIVKFSSTAASVTIPSELDGYPVTAIATDQAWSSIGGAFENNSSMQTVVIPASVKKIDARAFKKCSGLQQVLIGDGVVEIGEYAFDNCDYMQRVQIKGTTLRTIGKGAFIGCDALDNFTIPESVTTIGADAFKYCTALSSIVIPDAVIEFGGGTFTGCTALAEATIGDGITELKTNGSDTGGSDGWADGTFEDCTSLAKVTLGSGLKTIGTDAFCNTGLLEVTIPDNVETIGQGAFHGCHDMKTAVIGDGVKTMGNYAFKNCSSLEEVTIGNNVRTMGVQSFKYNTSLKEITIPSSVTSLGGGSFTGCTSLTKAVIGNGVPELGTNGSDTRGYDGWADGMFEDCTSLTEVELGDGIITIGIDAFCNTKLINVNIPDNVVTIGNGAYTNCVSLEEVTIGTGVTSLGNNTFANDPALKKVSLGKGVVSIGNRAFAYCTSLESLMIPSNVTALGGGLCVGCTSLTNVIIGNGVTGLAGNGSDTRGYDGWVDGAFEGCTSLTDVALGSGLTSIGVDTFTDTKLTSLLIPAKVSSVGNGFAYNTGISNIYFTGAAPTFGKEIYGAAETSLFYIDGKTGYDSVDNYTFSTFTPIKVAFDLNNENVFAIQPNDQLMAPEGGYVIEPINPMAEDYVFLGWYADKACTESWDFMNDKVTEDTTIYADWVRRSDIAPDAPKAPTVENADHTSVSIKWDSVEGADNYNIYVNGELVTTTPVSNNTYKITGLEADSWYEVSISASNAAGTSEQGLVKVVMTSEAPVIPEFIKGDANEDTQVTLEDAQLTLKAALKIITLEGAAALAADVTGNGDGITLGDAQLILKVALKITTF